jgi:hypothetical protein
MTDNKINSKTSFVITKRIAKHGSQAIIVIPRILESRLKPGTIAQLTIDILDEENLNLEGGENGN